MSESESESGVAYLHCRCVENRVQRKRVFQSLGVLLEN